MAHAVSISSPKRSLLSTGRGAAAAVVLLAGLALTGAVPAWAGGIAPDLKEKLQAGKESSEPVSVIVQFQHARVDPEKVARAAGGAVQARHRLIDGATVRLPLKAVAGLSHNPNVAWISPDRTLA